jgi:hypothetical protein
MQDVDLKTGGTMSIRVRNHRFGLVGTLAVAVLGLGGLALPLTPANAQCLGVDLGLVCAGLGVPSAFSHPNAYYYGYPNTGYRYAAYPAYTYPYYNPYYPVPQNPYYPVPQDITPIAPLTPEDR